MTAKAAHHAGIMLLLLPHLDQIICRNDLQVAWHRFRLFVLLDPHTVGLPLSSLHVTANRKLQPQPWRSPLARLACCLLLLMRVMLRLLLCMLLLVLLLCIVLLLCLLPLQVFVCIWQPFSICSRSAEAAVSTRAYYGRLFDFDLNGNLLQEAESWTVSTAKGVGCQGQHAHAATASC